MLSTFDPPDDTAWSLSGRAEINATHGSYSAPNAMWLFGSNFLGTEEGSVAQRTFTVTPGQPYPVRMWVNGDSQGSVTLSAFLTSGSVSVQYDLTAPLGSGWQLWESGAFTPETSSVQVDLFVGPPASSGSGSWVVDDFELDEGADMPALGKWNAVQAAINVLKGIDGDANGWKTNLGARVYTRLFFPLLDAALELPYACVPLEQEGETIEYEGFGYVSTWRLVGYAFFADDPESNVRESSGAEAAANFRDDLLRAFMADQSLSGVTQNCEVTHIETAAGSVDDGTTWVVFTVEFTQHAGAQDLVSE